MKHFDPEPEVQRHKVREAEIRLARHARRTRIILTLLVVLTVVLLTLVMSDLWNHPWTQDSIRDATG